ncbi:MAG TPA: helix-turn-helix transcriptional regulator [Patescibacteria group bacterium]|nr:helix-turn-helix transcriptional regulator [Patescibacteria group bacterium]
MATSERPRARAEATAQRIRREIGEQIRIARRATGLSLRATAGPIGIDYSTLARIERGLIDRVSIEQVTLACVAVGLEPSLRAYPRGDATRDAGHLRLLGRFRARLPPSVPWETEVPLPIPGDLRALDARTRLAGRSIGIEAETRLADVQAVERRALLKKRDSGVDLFILLVADTRTNRAALGLHRDAVRGALPLDTRAILAAVGRGRAPEADGIVVL